MSEMSFNEYWEAIKKIAKKQAIQCLMKIL